MLNFKKRVFNKKPVTTIQFAYTFLQFNSDIYLNSVYLQIKSPCKKHFPSPLNLR